jgi:single-stranded DNA-binding protein
VSAHLLVEGKLITQPQVRETKNGGSMCNAVIATHVESRSEDDDGNLVFSVIAFGDAAEQLALHGKMDSIAVTGTLQVSQWEGQRRFGILADSVESVRTSRERARRRRSEAQAA